MASIISGSISSLNGTLVASPAQNFGTIAIQISGTWVGTLTFKGSQDGTTYVNNHVVNIQTNHHTATTSANGQFIVTSAGLQSFEVVMTSYTSGTANISFEGARDVRLMRAVSTSYDASGTEVGTPNNPYIAQPMLHVSEALLEGRLFTAHANVVAASGSVDNPILLLINPVSNTKTFYIYRIMTGVNVTNVPVLYKLFANPTLTSAAKTITNITQTGLSTTVTVTTSTAHNGAIGSTVVITGTTNFNGTYTIAGVTSSTIFTFTRTANLVTLTESSGTATVATSLGTSLTPVNTRLMSGPVATTAVAYTTSTVSSNGTSMMGFAEGQNAAGGLLVDAPFVSLAPGQNILITAQPASNNREMSISVLWDEMVAP